MSDNPDHPRDYFAAQALGECIAWVRLKGCDDLQSDGGEPWQQPLLPSSDIDEGEQAEEIAKLAYCIADAMLAERKGTSE